MDGFARKYLAIGLAAFGFCYVGSESRAADLPPAPAHTAPAVVRHQAYSWTGAYFGLMGGYAFGSGDVSDFSGAIVGGTVGYNWQPANSFMVFGVEIDGGWSSFGDSVSVSGGGITITVKSEADAIATLRARFGAAFDRTLVYLTGGGAWARNEISIEVAGGGFTAGISDTQHHFGYVAGAGVEQAFARNWSAKIEYNYIGFGSKVYFSNIAGGITSGDIDLHVVKAGLNYRF